MRNQFGRVVGLATEIGLGLFILGLLISVWMAPHRRLDPKTTESVLEGASAPPLTTAQGTPLAGVITDSIGLGAPFFTGERLFLSGIAGDAHCLVISAAGNRAYHEYFFVNQSPTTERVSVGLSSGCGTIISSAAYTPRFSPPDLCNGLIASAGRAGTSFWDFNICPGAQFSIIVYAVSPGATCTGYSLSVFGIGIVQVPGPGTNGGVNGFGTADQFAGADALQSSALAPEVDSMPPATDVQPRKFRHPHEIDATVQLVPAAGTIPLPSPLVTSPGTQLVTTITDFIDGSPPSFTGQRLFRSGIISNTACSLFGAVATRPYEEVFFQNISPNPERVTVSFVSGCGFNTFMAAYSPGFDPTNICSNFVADAGGSGSVTWDFLICAGARFSIVVFGLEPGLLCPSYSYTVVANHTVLLGSVADLAISKTVAPGPTTPGSNIAYTITARDLGPNHATGINLTDPLPPGTTFVSLSAVNASCTTPSPGSPGVMNCSIPLLTTTGGTSLATMNLVVKVGAGAGSVISNTATVSRVGIDPNPANNSATATAGSAIAFNQCLQDATTHDLIKFNSTTGDYLYVQCRPNGLALSGRAIVSGAGCTVSLTDQTAGRNVVVTFNSCSKTATAAITPVSGGPVFKLSGVISATCSCPASK